MFVYSTGLKIVKNLQEKYKQNLSKKQNNDQMQEELDEEEKLDNEEKEIDSLNFEYKWSSNNNIDQNIYDRLKFFLDRQIEDWKLGKSKQQRS